MSEAAAILTAEAPATEQAPVTAQAQTPAETLTQAPAPEGEKPWFSTIKDPDIAQWVENKKFADPEVALKSYRNLEQLFGADKAGNTIRIPKDMSNAEEVGAVFAKLGKPETVDGYGLDKVEGLSPEDAKFAAEWSHKHHLTKAQAEGMVKEWQTLQNQTMEQIKANQLAEENKQEAKLKEEWGGNFEKNTAIAQRAVRELGLDTETISRLQAAMGYDGVFKFAHALGTKMLDDSFIASVRNGQSFGDHMTPEMAKARLSDLQRDKDWYQKYVSGDSGAKREFDKLTQAIANAQKAG